MAMCIDCNQMNLGDRNDYGEAYCIEKGRYYDPYSSTCSYYNDTYESRSSREWENQRESDRYGNQKDHICYITTTVCDILKFEDDCTLLNVLRNLRDEYMMKNPACIPLLIEYNVLGPEISKNLMNEKDSKIFAKSLLSNYLLEAVKHINIGEYKEAVNIYISMVNSLKERYNISNIDIEGIDIEHLITTGVNKDDIKTIANNLIRNRKRTIA